MTISQRSVKRAVREKVTAPMTEDAYAMIRLHIEEEAPRVAQKAEACLRAENEMHRSLGERERVRVTARHVLAALRGEGAENGGQTPREAL